MKGARFDPGLASYLEEVYAACNVPARIGRDPLAVALEYPDRDDRELAALACSTLAFGAVDLILRACRAALAPLGTSPARALDAMGPAEISDAWRGFQYRFCFGKDLAALMLGAKRARSEAGSLADFFARGDPGGPHVGRAASAFARGIKVLGPGLRENLLPDPARGSACKRLFLFLRWMVRRDAVDPGLWRGVDPARLLVPLDLHMVKTCRERLGFIESPYASLRNALAATEAFALYSPGDPVKYDFALTRLGIDPRPGDERFLEPERAEGNAG